jgi:trimethylamine---corrinoid protein Co-methyltransferase
VRASIDLLSGEELRRIHDATLSVLTQTGVLVEDGEAREILDGCGCEIQGHRVFMGEQVVGRALHSCPETFTLHGRDPKKDCPLEPGKAYSLSTTGCPFVVDIETGERRHALVQDLADLTRLVDALPYVHMASPLTPKDVEPEIVSPVRVATMLRNTVKPMRIAVESGAEVRYIRKVAAAAHGGEARLRDRPQLQVSVSPLSPLTLSADAASAVVETARAGIPLGVIPAPIVGATGPMSLAGSLVQQNAEILAGIVLAQAVAPGHPVVYEPRLTVMDMRTGQSIWGNPEVALTHAAAAQLARHYRVPGSVTSFGTSSKGMDDQNGYERAFNLMLTVLAGANILGSLDSGDNVVHAAADLHVLDDELVNWVFKLMAGFSVDDSSLAVDAVNEAASSGTGFLGLLHTRDYMRAGEVWTPVLSERANFVEWEQAGRPTTRDRARERARSLMATHSVEPLPEDVDRHIDEAIAEARRELVGPRA